MTAPETPLLFAHWRRMRPLIFVGLAVGAVRLVLDFAHVEAAMWIGVYYALPVALLVAGIRGTYDGVSWWQLVVGMSLVSMCCWLPANTIAYTAAQFLGWTHGRFAPGRAPPIADEAGRKIMAGITTGALTSVAGTLWLGAWSTVLVWIPGRVRARRAAR